MWEAGSEEILAEVEGKRGVAEEEFVEELEYGVDGREQGEDKGVVE